MIECLLEFNFFSALSAQSIKRSASFATVSASLFVTRDGLHSILGYLSPVSPVEYETSNVTKLSVH
jgi:hypothetical protein